MSTFTALIVGHLHVQKKAVLLAINLISMKMFLQTVSVIFAMYQVLSASVDSMMMGVATFVSVRNATILCQIILTLQKKEELFPT